MLQLCLPPRGRETRLPSPLLAAACENQAWDWGGERELGVVCGDVGKQAGED